MTPYEEPDDSGPFSVRRDPPQNMRIELFQTYNSWNDGDWPDGFYERTQEFADDVEMFLQEHDVYDVAFSASAANSGMFYEVWVFYEEDEE